jgi:hypothetical protein
MSTPTTELKTETQAVIRSANGRKLLTVGDCAEVNSCLPYLDANGCLELAQALEKAARMLAERNKD